MNMVHHLIDGIVHVMLSVKNEGTFDTYLKLSDLRLRLLQNLDS
jgi:hypothetical protein